MLVNIVTQFISLVYKGTYYNLVQYWCICNVITLWSQADNN